MRAFVVTFFLLYFPIHAQAAIETKSDSLYFPIEVIGNYVSDINACAAEDDRMKFYSWGEKYSSHGVACQIRTSDGGSRVIIFDEEHMYEPESSHYDMLFEGAWVSSLHSLKKSDGSTYYIAKRAVDMNGDVFMWMDAFAIVDDTIKHVSVYDGGDDLDDCGMDIRFNHYARLDFNQYHLFEYDPATKELHVPQVIDGSLTDRYRVYRFDGEGFAKRGLQPHKGLHESLHLYRELVRCAKTERNFIRIDRLEDGSLRYASWRTPADISRKPDIILHNGVYNEDTNEYIFRNGKYTYIVGYFEFLDEDDWRSWQEYLVIKYNDKVLSKQAIENSLSEQNL